MSLVPDKGAIQELSPASPDPSFGDRVHTRCADVAEHGLDAGIGEDHVECGGKVRAAVADHELDLTPLVAEVHEEVAGLLGGPFPGGIQGDAEDADPPGRVLDYSQDVGLGAVEQVDREEIAGQDRLGLGAQELWPGRPGLSPGGIDAAGLRISQTVDVATLTPRPAISPWILRYSHSGFSQASRRTSAWMFRRVAGRPVLPRMDLAAQRRRRMSRCQRTIVSGVTSSRSLWRCALAITLSRAASSARSAQFSFGRRGCRRCRMASWWRRIKISAVFHISSRRESRSPATSRVIRRNTNRRHMTADHHRRTVGRATMLVRAVDEILGTHNADLVKRRWTYQRRTPGRPCTGPEALLRWLIADGWRLVG
jgi:hypothetical protein